MSSAARGIATTVLLLYICVACSGTGRNADASGSSEILTNERTQQRPESSRRAESNAPTREAIAPSPVLQEEASDSEEMLNGNESRASAHVELADRFDNSSDAPSREWKVFSDAPPWPFTGLVHLSASGGFEPTWSLWYIAWDDQPWASAVVPLPGFQVDCLGEIGLVSHGAQGIEIGGPDGAAMVSYLVPWGGVSERMVEPSNQLLQEIRRRPSSVVVHSVGDRVRIVSHGSSATYTLRDPVRIGGNRWSVQALHDGALFTMTMHPAHRECFSGVTWISDAATGAVLACGSSTAATRFVDAAGGLEDELVLPTPAEVGTYLSCAQPMERQLAAIGSAARERAGL